MEVLERARRLKRKSQSFTLPFHHPNPDSSGYLYILACCSPSPIKAAASRTQRVQVKTAKFSGINRFLRTLGSLISRRKSSNIKAYLIDQVIDKAPYPMPVQYLLVIWFIHYA